MSVQTRAMHRATARRQSVSSTHRDRAVRPRRVARSATRANARADEDNAADDDDGHRAARIVDRRRALSAMAATCAIAVSCEPSSAKLTGGITGGVPIENFKPIPGTEPPILYYDVKGEAGTTGGAPKGSRVAVHYDLKFRSITVGTSRQGAGVTGGNPIGFTVGQPAGTSGGPFIKAFNEGIKGMGVGTVRRMIVPPEYAYGPNEVMEIPANATVTLDVELLSVAKDPLTRQIAVEGSG